MRIAKGRIEGIGSAPRLLVLGQGRSQLEHRRISVYDEPVHGPEGSPEVACPIHRLGFATRKQLGIAPESLVIIVGTDCASKDACSFSLSPVHYPPAHRPGFSAAKVEFMPS